MDVNACFLGKKQMKVMLLVHLSLTLVKYWLYIASFILYWGVGFGGVAFSDFAIFTCNTLTLQENFIFSCLHVLFPLG